MESPTKCFFLKKIPQTKVGLFSAALLLFTLFSQAQPLAEPSPQSRPSFKKMDIKVNKVKLNIEVATNDQERAYGLMFKNKLGDNEGMLFVFKDEYARSFWMKNTLVDLSIGFFNAKKVLVDLKDMEAVKSPNDIPRTYNSFPPSMYALEMPLGWFKKNKIEKGAILSVSGQ